MKTKLIATLATISLGVIPAAMAMQSDAANSAATVEFLEPENFTDFRMSEFGGGKEQKALEKEMRKAVEQAAQRHLPPGFHLNLRFRDIDMAGDFEPWRSPNFNDVRIVRDIYAPRLDMEYEIVNETGEVVASGSKKVSDMNHLWRLRLRSSDMLESESELVSDFIRDIARTVS